ncbi:hypothetical protein [Levilactobacillus brevis]|uniref:hypothetical protein n=1 Tax=Levilactobacillus brevis TaxID=1580 RepID=UPI003D17B861
MHIASIGWTDNPEEMQRELDWLKKDMAATKQTWRIVTTHQPAYNKNPADARLVDCKINPNAVRTKKISFL